MGLETLFIQLGYSKDEYEMIRNAYGLSGYKDVTFSEKLINNYNLKYIF